LDRDPASVKISGVYSELEFSLADPASAEATAIVAAMEAEIEALYSDRYGSIHSIGAGPEVMSESEGGSFVLLRSGGRPVGGGGLKRIADDTCEIKRMYLDPAVRGRGVAADLLTALEDRAREMGYAKVRLDTGDRQPAAKRLYEGAGYRAIPDYNGNPMARFWFEKEL
jgi:GNAT superfamily N-acetyltransferase